MKPELQQKLYERYPKIFRQKDLPGTETCMNAGICMGDGWFHILDALCYSIQNFVRARNQMCPDEEPMVVEAVQVKEKSGTFRFYHTSRNPFINGLVRMAGAIASYTCERCGNPGQYSPSGRSVLCDACCTAGTNTIEDDK